MRVADYSGLRARHIPLRITVLTTVAVAAVTLIAAAPARAAELTTDVADPLSALKRIFFCKTFLME